MKANPRTMVGLGLLAVLLIGISLWRWHGPESAVRAVKEDEPAPAEPRAWSTAKPGQRVMAQRPMPGAAGAQALPPNPTGEVSAECKACRESTCTNYKHLGYDVLNGCLDTVDPSEGADKADARFNADCLAVVRCATQTRCAQGAAGPLGCYCGSKGVDDCIEIGPAADAPCVEEWKRAARTSDHHELLLRWSDLKYPTGWANLLIECDRDDCKNQCS